VSGAALLASNPETTVTQVSYGTSSLQASTVLSWHSAARSRLVPAGPTHCSAAPRNQPTSELILQTFPPIEVSRETAQIQFESVSRG
jgi:hypothetical protein